MRVFRTSKTENFEEVSSSSTLEVPGKLEIHAPEETINTFVIEGVEVARENKRAEK